VEIDTNRYSVPWRWIGQSVRVLLADEQVRIEHAERELAVHPQLPGRRQCHIEVAHLEGIVGAPGCGTAGPPGAAPAQEASAPLPSAEWLRPLSD
jgi:hypothetical protein